MQRIHIIDSELQAIKIEKQQYSAQVWDPYLNLLIQKEISLINERDTLVKNGLTLEIARFRALIDSARAVEVARIDSARALEAARINSALALAVARINSPFEPTHLDSSIETARKNEKNISKFLNIFISVWKLINHLKVKSFCRFLKFKIKADLVS